MKMVVFVLAMSADLCSCFAFVDTLVVESLPDDQESYYVDSSEDEDRDETPYSLRTPANFAGETWTGQQA